jgi:hypothetical protein
MDEQLLLNLEKCPKCGADGKLRITCGGPYAYYAIHCTKCDHDSRGMGNLLPQLYSDDTPDTPQKSMELACEAWNKIAIFLKERGY